MYDFLLLALANNYFQFLSSSLPFSLITFDYYFSVVESKYSSK